MTAGVSASLLMCARYGFVVVDFWAAFLGFHAAVMAKIWFVDRMVWLYGDMQDADPTYQSWVYWAV